MSKITQNTRRILNFKPQMLKKTFIYFSLISFLLTSCGATPSLWGEYSTPTPEGFASGQAIQVPVAAPTREIFPTPSAFVTAPPLNATQVPTLASPAENTEVAPALNPDAESILYYSQSGDYLETVALHFGVEVAEITSTETLPSPRALLNPNTLLVIPDRLLETTSNELIFPDSEIVFSATAIDFDTLSFIAEQEGYLKDFEEYLGSTGWTSGAEGIARLAKENSINPRLLTALVEYESGWVLGQPGNLF